MPLRNATRARSCTPARAICATRFAISDYAEQRVAGGGVRPLCRAVRGSGGSPGWCRGGVGGIAEGARRGDCRGAGRRGRFVVVPLVLGSVRAAGVAAEAAGARSGRERDGPSMSGLPAVQGGVRWRRGPGPASRAVLLGPVAAVAARPAPVSAVCSRAQGAHQVQAPMAPTGLLEVRRAATAGPSVATLIVVCAERPGAPTGQSPCPERWREPRCGSGARNSHPRGYPSSQPIG